MIRAYFLGHPVENLIFAVLERKLIYHWVDSMQCILYNICGF